MLKNLCVLFDKFHFVNDYILNLNLTGIQLDSRLVFYGNLFIAMPGKNTDGRNYIDQALKKGAIAILSESWGFHEKITYIKNFFYNCSVPVFYINNIGKNLSGIAGQFYHHPSYFLNVIGVTGTNGKTTVSCLLSNWLQLLGEKSAVMGTVGYGPLQNLSFFCGNTTYSAIDNQRLLAKFLSDNISFVAMEISSHGLDQYRVDALYFKVAIFTNLSCDHLDYHKNIARYKAAKWRLFSEFYVENYVVNADDITGYQWLFDLPQAIAVTVTGQLPPFWKGRWISAVHTEYHENGMDIHFNSSWGYGVIYSQLLGTFNVSNILLALGALLALGYCLSTLLKISFQLKPVCGRMEIFNSYKFKKPTVVVDYAHTPDALKKVLVFFKKYYCRGKLWCVFGCGGERDKSKRRLMGIISAKYSDYVIITNDNPRFEDPKEIIKDIVSDMNIKNGGKLNAKIQVIQNRSCAIKTAILQSTLDDLVLVAGKGHEKYQIIGNRVIYYSDRDVVRDILDNY